MSVRLESTRSSAPMLTSRIPFSFNALRKMFWFSSFWKRDGGFLLYFLTSVPDSSSYSIIGLTPGLTSTTRSSILTPRGFKTLFHQRVKVLSCCASCASRIDAALLAKSASSAVVPAGVLFLPKTPIPVLTSPPSSASVGGECSRRVKVSVFETSFISASRSRVFSFFGFMKQTQTHFLLSQ